MADKVDLARVLARGRRRRGLPEHGISNYFVQRRGRDAMMMTFPRSLHRVVDLEAALPVWKSKFYVAFVLNRRVDLHAIDAPPCSMAWRCRFLAARRSQRGHVVAEK